MRKIVLSLSLIFLNQSSLAQTKGAVSNDLQNSQFCAKAARDFGSQNEWKEKRKLHLSMSITSHFNRSLNKCLVKVRSIDTVPKTGEIMEMNHIYDSLDGNVLGGKIFLKVRDGTDYKIKTVTLVKDEKFIREPSEAAAFVQWFDALMVE